MTTETEDNNYPPYYKIINKSEVVEKKGFLTFFAIDERTLSIVCEFNHEYPLNTRKVMGPIDIDNWTNYVGKTVKKKLVALPVEIKKEHVELIQGNLDQEYDNIVDVVLALKNKNKNNNYGSQNEQQQNQDTTTTAVTTSNLSFAEWSIQLVEKYQELQKEIIDLTPELWEPTEFALSVRTILRINSITLPFAGILLGPSGGLKTATVGLYRHSSDTEYRDSFSAKSFQSHNSAIPKEKLEENDLLPAIRDKLLLTPELSPIFSKREDELNEILGIWTRVLDGQGLESQSGAQGHRAYIGKYMFVWIGAAVDIPRKVHKLLGTLGPKLYFFRIKTKQKDENYYLEQQEEEKIKGDFNQKIEKIKSKMNDYLQFFDFRPFDYDTVVNKNNDFIDKNVLLLIIRLAILLRHLRANVPVYESKDSHGSDYAYTSVSFEEPDRAITLLKYLARAHALSQGRDRITLQDIPLLIKVVLSTASKERVILFDHLLENNGQLDTLSIKDHMIISKNTALKTMAEFYFLKLVDRIEMQNSDPEDHKSFQIILKDEFKWFLTDEFKKLREDFGKEYHDEYVKSKQEKQQSKDNEDDNSEKDE
jgi:hypothetical protein